MENYYDILGVSPSATREEIKQAYRQLARQFHPDVRPKNVDATERFKAINEAYQTLINIERRAAYDAQQQRQVSTQEIDKNAPKPNTTPTRHYPHQQHEEHTHAFIRTVFIIVLLTLIVIVAQVLLFMQAPTPNLIQRPAEGSSAEPTAIPIPSTAIPVFERERTTPLTAVAAAEALDSCIIDFRQGEENCSALASIDLREDSAEGQAVLKIDFAAAAAANRIMFRVEYEGLPEGWTVNIGDSVRNAGTVGDGVVNTADAQVSVFGQDILVYGNELQQNEQLARIIDAVPSDGAVFFVISHMQLLWSAPDAAELIQSQYLFLLDGNRYEEQRSDSNIYAAFNRTIANAVERDGSGVSRVTLWFLP